MKKSIAGYIALFFFVDILSKYLAYILCNSRIGICTYILNIHAARSVQIPIIFLIVMGLICMPLFYLAYSRGYTKKRTTIFLLSGIGGNLYDRFVFHGVRDRISIGSFPIFNMADIFITLGVLLYILSEYKKSTGHH